MKKVVSHYSEAHRHYHNVTHIRRLFEHAQRYGVELTQAQRIAILFHDVIYDTSSKTNEEDSVDEMRLLCQIQDANDDFNLEVAGDIILATKHHQCDDEEIATVLDLDLIELGFDWSRYIYNEQNIRKEYSQYSDDQWKMGRKNFLESMLMRDHIFNTDYFRDNFEQKARDNIIASLATL